jgi:uncharacterized membrane protein
VAVEVQTEIEIARPRERVAAYAGDPDNAPSWQKKIVAVDWQSPKPVAVGSQIAFAARFLGGRLAYTYEVTELVPGERLAMATSEGPFPMETTYLWEDTPTGGTRMTLRNRGGHSGSRVAARLMTGSIRRANRKDLRRLKSLLERPGAR